MSDAPADLPDNLGFDDRFFPAVFVKEIAQALYRGMPNHEVAARPIRSVDPGFMLGVWSEEWIPNQQTYQMGQFEPVEASYIIRIQNSVKAASEEEGRAMFSLNAKALRVILARDEELRVRLLSLSEEILQSRENVMRYRITRQRFATMRPSQGVILIATTDVAIDTETTYVP